MYTLRIKSRQWKRIALKTAIVINIFISSVFGSHYLTAQEISYQVLIDDGKLDNTEEFIFKTLEEVAHNYNFHTGQTLDTTQVFVGTDIYFQYRTTRKIYYCEKVKIVTDRKGNKVFKRIKKKELKDYSKLR